MPSYRIASAMSILEDLVSVLDKAYWEANAMNVKDAVYDCISSINTELSELNKLSIQDHDMMYEPISIEFKIAAQRMGDFRKFLDEHIVRSATISRLDHSVSSVMALISPDPNEM